MLFPPKYVQLRHSYYWCSGVYMHCGAEASWQFKRLYFTRISARYVPNWNEEQILGRDLFIGTSLTAKWYLFNLSGDFYPVLCYLIINYTMLQRGWQAIRRLASHHHWFPPVKIGSRKSICKVAKPAALLSSLCLITAAVMLCQHNSLRPYF